MGADHDLKAILGENSLILNDYTISDPKSRPGVPHDGYDQDSESIPSIDLKNFRSSSTAARQTLLEELKKGVSAWGFVQVCGHSLDEDAVKEIMAFGRDFFTMPVEDKMKALVDPAGKQAGYYCGSTMPEGLKMWREAFQSWGDQERFKADFADKIWTDPAESEKASATYHKFVVAIEEMVLELLELLEEAVGVKKGEFCDRWERLKGTFVVFNYYPPCDDPKTVNGATPHTDPGFITILLQEDIGGLQILKDGKWVACKPRAGYFVVNIGDMLQVLSNDIFPSVQHRAVVNNAKPRITVATFSLPALECEIKPAAELVDEKNPAHYNSFKFLDFCIAATKAEYKGKQVLPLFKCDA